jgi:hypothetical protein
VLVALALTTLLLFAALAVDVGAVWASRTQSQNAGDAAALAAAQTMISSDGRRVDEAAARAAATDVAAANSTIANPSVALRPGDIELGSWNPDSREFTNKDGETDPNLVNAARVKVVMDGAANNRSPSFFSRLLGRNGFDVTNTATAYLGFAGSWETGTIDLPIAIDSWNLTGGHEDSCGERAFCNEVDGGSPPIPCTITSAHRQNHDGHNDVSCLRFTNDEPGSRRNACWTSFDPGLVDETQLMDLIESGSPRDLRAGDAIDLADDVGGGGGGHPGRDALISEIGRHFYGDGVPAKGEDVYPGSSGGPDSWVVQLAVVEPQNFLPEQCSGSEGEAARIVGSVCFEIREVEYGPGVDARIKGNFLCPTSTDARIRARYEAHCMTAGGTALRGTAPGGCNFGMRAARAVLVE